MKFSFNANNKDITTCFVAWNCHNEFITDETTSENTTYFKIKEFHRNPIY